MPNSENLSFKTYRYGKKRSGEPILDRSGRSIGSRKSRYGGSKESHNERVQKTVRLYEHVGSARISRCRLEIIQWPNGYTGYAEQNTEGKENTIGICGAGVVFYAHLSL